MLKESAMLSQREENLETLVPRRRTPNFSPRAAREIENPNPKTGTGSPSRAKVPAIGTMPEETMSATLPIPGTVPYHGLPRSWLQNNSIPLASKPRLTLQTRSGEIVNVVPTRSNRPKEGSDRKPPTGASRPPVVCEVESPARRKRRTL